MAGIVAGTHTGDLHVAAAVGGVNEVTVTDVDADMGNAAGVCIGKEHQVTGLQILLLNVSTVAILPIGGTGNGEAALAGNILNKTGAVKAAGRRSTPNIASTQILPCNVGHHLAGSRRLANGCITGLIRTGADVIFRNSRSGTADSGTAGII